MRVVEKALEILRPNENESGREYTFFESACEPMRAHESLRPKENKSGGREFKLVARESMRVHESLRREERDRSR